MQQRRTHLDLKGACQTARIISLVLMLSLGIYAFIGFFLQNQPATYDPEFIGLIRVVFILMVPTMVILIGVLRKQILNPKTAPNHNADEAFWATKLMTTHIMTYALAEAIAIYGFILFILGKNPNDYFGFAGFCLLLMVFYFPNLTKWQEHVKKISSDQNKPILPN